MMSSFLSQGQTFLETDVKVKEQTLMFILVALGGLIMLVSSIRKRSHLASGRVSPGDTITAPKAYFTDPFNIYLINMSKDTARLQHFQKTFAESDLSPLGFTRIEAINGRLVNIPTIVSRRALSEMLIAEKLGYRSRHYHITRGSVGCFLSHQKTWQSILDTNAPAGLIFEDDATLTPSLLGRLKTMRIPLDYDIILLGHWCHACQVIGQSSDVLRVRSWFGLHGYIIHQRGIKKILNNPNFLPIRKQVDLQLSEMAASGDLIVYALKQQLVRQNNEEFMTTIQTPMKKVPGQDPFDPN